MPLLYPLGLATYGLRIALFGAAGLRQKRPPFIAALPLVRGVLGVALFPALVVMDDLPAVGLAVLLAHGVCWLLLGYALWRTGTPAVADAANAGERPRDGGATVKDAAGRVRPRGRG